MKYVFCDWAKGLSIRVVAANKESGTVTVKCRSEVFDDHPVSSVFSRTHGGNESPSLEPEKLF